MYVPNFPPAGYNIWWQLCTFYKLASLPLPKLLKTVVITHPGINASVALVKIQTMYQAIFNPFDK